MNTQAFLGGVIILFLLIFSIPSINNQIITQSESANATTFDEFTGAVFPLFLSIIPFAWGGVLIFMGLKEIR